MRVSGTPGPLISKSTVPVAEICRDDCSWLSPVGVEVTIAAAP
jgi:hypothetical protein